MKKIVFLLTLAASQIGWTECAFCQKEILNRQTFAKENGAIGMLTYKPCTPGHVLIIPERHVERFEDLTSEEIAAIGEMIKKVDLAVRNAYGNTDYLLLQKNGTSAGQSVPHVHFHYIPSTQFLTVRFFLAPWLPPLNEGELLIARETLQKAGPWTEYNSEGEAALDHR